MNYQIKKLEFIFNLRRCGVTEPKVLSAMESIPRENFVSINFKRHALDDVALPLENGRTTTQPSIVGTVTQSLSPTPRSKILEICTGSGYQTAILAKLSRRVYSLEAEKRLAQNAQNALDNLGIKNVTLIVKDGSKGLIEQAPFDRIVLTAATDDVPRVLLDQLKIDGVLIAPVGASEKFQKLVKVKKEISGYQYSELKTARFLPLTQVVNQQDETS